MVIASARKIEYATGAMRGRALTSNGDGENEGGEGEETHGGQRTVRGRGACGSEKKGGGDEEGAKGREPWARCDEHRDLLTRPRRHPVRSHGASFPSLLPSSPPAYAGNPALPTRCPCHAHGGDVVVPLPDSSRTHRKQISRSRLVGDDVYDLAGRRLRS